jgi:hypothetical protein
MNKILEIVEKKEKVVVRTGSLSDWIEGYPEKCWKTLCELENGEFFEDENEIRFFTTQKEKIGVPKRDSFLRERTSQKVIYASTDFTIEKNLIEKGVFEITDRVGHYIKIKVDPMVDEIASLENDFKFVRLNGQQLALLYIALSKGLFQRPKKGQVYYEAHTNSDCTLYFKRDYYPTLMDSISKACYFGKFAQSNAEADWNDLMNTLKRSEISKKENIETLELYSIYE